MWYWWFCNKKRHNYGTFLVDHDSREFVDIIDSRKVDNVQEWLKIFKNLSIVSRDRALIYSFVIKEAIIQVYDRFHICKIITENVENIIKALITSKILVNVKNNKVEEGNDDLGVKILKDKQKINYESKVNLFN